MREEERRKEADERKQDEDDEWKKLDPCRLLCLCLSSSSGPPTLRLTKGLEANASRTAAEAVPSEASSSATAKEHVEEILGRHFLSEWLSSSAAEG